MTELFSQIRNIKAAFYTQLLTS